MANSRPGSPNSLTIDDSLDNNGHNRPKPWLLAPWPMTPLSSLVANGSPFNRHCHYWLLTPSSLMVPFLLMEPMNTNGANDDCHWHKWWWGVPLAPLDAFRIRHWRQWITVCSIFVAVGDNDAYGGMINSLWHLCRFFHSRLFAYARYKSNVTSAKLCSYPTRKI